jgi:predicted permease
MWNDLRVGLRLLWKEKAFSLTAVLTLALCIGANAALFSVVHHVLLRPLPIPGSERILIIGNSYPGAGQAGPGSVSVPDHYDHLRDVTVFEEQALYNGRNQHVDQNGTPTRVRVNQVTPSFFRLLGVAPAIGRTFTEQDGEVGSDKKVVLSYAMWQSQFGGNPNAIGRDLRIDGQPFTVIGVMPQGFYYLNANVMLWRPLAFTPQQKDDSQRHSNNYQNIARLKPGATLQQVQAQIDAINAANLDRFPQYKELLINAGFHTIVQPLQSYVVRDVKATLYLMWGGALFVLLIGGVNIANLVLVRSRARIKELATRLALGAGRWRVGRQLVTETLVLTFFAAVAGLLVGYGTLRLFATLNIQDVPRGLEIRLDAAVIAYTLAIAALAGVVLGLIPVANILPASLTTVLREEGRSSTTGRGARTLRRTLVVAQVGFAFVLLTGAGLLFASFRQVLAVDPGFRAEGVLTASISLPRSRYNREAMAAFTNDALRRLRALPGVTAAGATNTIPFGGNNNDSVILAEGYQMKPGESVISPSQVVVTPGYFESIGVKLVRGRFFDARDSATAAKAIIVDETLARRFWPGRDPIGRRMYMPTDINNLLAVTDKTVWLHVVGVIGDVKLHDLTEGRNSVGACFFPADQAEAPSLTFALKTSGDPAALTSGVRRALAELDRELPVYDTLTLEERLEKSLIGRRSPVVLSLAFGVVALLLSAIGIYGVLAYLVTQRTKEIGIRIALGSSAAGIVELVIREGLLLVGAGFAIGAAGALALRRSIESQLFGISATDPVVLATVTFVLAIVAVLACVLPARRATRIDPIVALAE